jgi:hypothetical protein
MKRKFLFAALILALSFVPRAPSYAQTDDTPTITFVNPRATAFELIQAVAHQTRVPIGVIVGQDQKGLFETTRSYEVTAETPRAALLDAIAGTGYSLRQAGMVFEVYAGDLTDRQHKLLTHTYENFGCNSPETTAMLGADLDMWMKVSVDEELGHEVGYAGSIGGSLDDEKFILKAGPLATTEEIANRIASLGSKGMWILRTNPTTPADSSTDEITFYPYQHYTPEKIAPQEALTRRSD